MTRKRTRLAASSSEQAEMGQPGRKRRKRQPNAKNPSLFKKDEINFVDLDGDQILDVECGMNKAVLHVSKLVQGSKGSCVSFQGSWLTPNEFQFVSGRETAKDWKRTIRHNGWSLKVLFANGILKLQASSKKLGKGQRQTDIPDSPVQEPEVKSTCEEACTPAIKPKNVRRTSKKRRRRKRILKDLNENVDAKAKTSSQISREDDLTKITTDDTEQKGTDILDGERAKDIPATLEEEHCEETGSTPFYDNNVENESAENNENGCVVDHKIDENNCPNVEITCPVEDARSPTQLFEVAPILEKEETSLAPTDVTRDNFQDDALETSCKTSTEPSTVDNLTPPPTPPDEIPKLEIVTPSVHPTEQNLLQDVELPRLYKEVDDNIQDTPDDVIAPDNVLSSTLPSVLNADSETKKNFFQNLNLMESSKDLNAPVYEKDELKHVRKLRRKRAIPMHRVKPMVQEKGESSANDNPPNSAEECKKRETPVIKSTVSELSSAIETPNTTSEIKLSSDDAVETERNEVISQAEVEAEIKMLLEASVKKTAKSTKTNSPSPLVKQHGECNAEQTKTDLDANTPSSNASEIYKKDSSNVSINGNLKRSHSEQVTEMQCGKSSSSSSLKRPGIADVKFNPIPLSTVKSNTDSSSVKNIGEIYKNEPQTKSPHSDKFHIDYLCKTYPGLNHGSPDLSSITNTRKRRGSPSTGSDARHRPTPEQLAKYSDYMKSLENSYCYRSPTGFFAPMMYPMYPNAMCHPAYCNGEKCSKTCRNVPRGMTETDIPVYPIPACPPNSFKYSPPVKSSLNVPKCVPEVKKPKHFVKPVPKRECTDKDQPLDLSVKKVKTDVKTDVKINVKADMMSDGPLDFSKPHLEKAYAYKQRNVVVRDVPKTIHKYDPRMYSPPTDGEYLKSRSWTERTTPPFKMVESNCTCGSGNVDDIRQWSVDRVYRFLFELEGCDIYAKVFREQGINGRLLPFLTSQHLTRTLGMKVGPALTLLQAVDAKLRETTTVLPCRYCVEKKRIPVHI